MRDTVLRREVAAPVEKLEPGVPMSGNSEMLAAADICAVVVTYHPDAHVVDGIQNIVPQVGQTVVVDNASSPSCVAELQEVCAKLSVHLIQNSENEGIARALNRGAQWADTEGHRWILTLDQDTTVAADMVDSLIEVFRGYPHPECLAVIGSNYTDKITGKPKLNLEPAGGAASVDSVSVLTSGSLVSLGVLKTIGGFRDDFFIDCVDHEYCLRARSRGFHVVLSTKPVMQHGIGYLTEHRLLWKKVGTSNHDAKRQYFMSRNSVILLKEYLTTEPRWMLGYLWDWLKSIVVVCLFEDGRASKMTNIFRGCWDGLSGRGSTVAE
jgi:rhamnosyltransferase